MALAVRMRGEGKSLREIATELAVDHHTIIRDLRRWEDRVSATGAKVVHFPGASRPAGGNLHQPVAPPATTGEVLGLTAKEEAMTRAIASLTNRR